MFATLDVFVFTLGLTEGWEAVEDGTMFPMAPGTVAGSYDPTGYRLRNLRVMLAEGRSLIRQRNAIEDRAVELLACLQNHRFRRKTEKSASSALW